MTSWRESNGLKDAASLEFHTLLEAYVIAPLKFFKIRVIEPFKETYFIFSQLCYYFFSSFFSSNDFWINKM